MINNVRASREKYEDVCKEYKTNPYRRKREYADYLDRFLHSDGVVDGMTAKDRANFLPMPYNKYFG